MNLAQRIEGLNRDFRTRLLVSEETAHAAALDSRFREVGTTPVRGRAAPVRLYTVDENA